MNAFTRSDAGIGSGRSERFHRWRTIQDQLFRRLITLGGISVIVAVVLILFYLIYVVFPLFLAPESDRFDLGENAQWQSSPAMYSAVEEQLELGLRIERSGAAEFFSLDGLNTVSQKSLVGEEQEIALVAEANQGNGSIAIFSSTGQMGVLRHSYETSFAQGVENRQIIPKLEYPYGEGLRDLTAGIAPSQAAVSDGDNGLLVAAVAERTLFVEISDKRENFLTGETTLDTRNISADLDFDATGLAISNNHRWIYVSNDIGQVQVLNAGTLEPIQTLKVSDHPITTITMLLGGISVLAGDESGTISQMFPVRDDSNQTELKLIRRFDGLSEPVVKILPEYRRKGFVAYDQAGNIGVYHSTAGQQVLFVPATSGVPSTAAVSPRANGLMQIRGARVEMLMLENEHPEVSLASLWKKVWYENYTEPQYIWQSSAASNEFEPKFSLTPLAFGTLKAALFAMLFAVPLSLMGAAYTAYFMAPHLREIVKPAIEIMAALPTVILGFLAGLWFAPFIESHLSAVVSILLVLPLGCLLFAYFWSQYQGRAKAWVSEGWEPALLLPVLVFLVYLSMVLADPLQNVFFGGDMRSWLSQEMGVSYDQRNALVVGFAMGFAVIPTIFSMAEDAVFGVPKSLSDGSLALGATPWQTLVRVILPTASPGIFSALMIGLGRAVGETMIVLMATGNTPVMDWSIFEGMRTLAANIAVEMPESEVNSSHYRILFLAALVLFIFTFVVNTGAELIRQRLREKYSSL